MKLLENLEADIIRIVGYRTAMQWEDIIGIGCALLLGHILTMLFNGYFHQKTIRDRKLSGFTVVRVDGEGEDAEDRFRINPHSTIENVDSIYSVFKVWLFGEEVASFQNLSRVKAVQLIFIVLAIVVTLVGIALCIHVTDGNFMPK